MYPTQRSARQSRMSGYVVCSHAYHPSCCVLSVRRHWMVCPEDISTTSHLSLFFFLTFPSSSTAQSLLVVVLCVLLGLLTNHLRLYGVLIAAAARVWRCKACTTTVTMLLFYILIKNYLHIKGWRKKKSSNISISNLLAPPQQSSNSALASITQWISVVKHVLCAPPLQSDGLSTERKE